MSNFTDFVASFTDKDSIQLALDKFSHRYALNAHMLLFCIWFSTEKKGRLQKNQLRDLLAALHPWHEAVLIKLKQLKQSIARKIPINKKAEHFHELVSPLVEEAEQVEQSLLQDVVSRMMTKPRNDRQQFSDACHNVTAYCKLMQVKLDKHDLQLMNEILASVFSTKIKCDNDVLLRTSEKGKVLAVNSSAQMVLWD